MQKERFNIYTMSNERYTTIKVSIHLKDFIKEAAESRGMSIKAFVERAVKYCCVKNVDLSKTRP